jgi:ankyrin repeat protein
MERPMSSIKFRQVFAGLAALVVVTASLGAIAGQIDKLLLHQSTSSGDIETLRYLLDHGAKVDRRSIIDHATPLHIASYSGDEAITRLLMARGADINAQMINGNTPLHMALAGGHVTIAKLLLDRGAKVGAQVGGTVTPPLLLAARSGHGALVEQILHHGADINSREPKSHATALIEATRNGHVDVVALLLNFGADVAKRDLGGRSALDVAQTQGHTKIVNLLSRSGF